MREAIQKELESVPLLKRTDDCGQNYSWPDYAALAEKVAPLVEALETISKGAGAFSRDPLTHASNVIDEAKATATKALAPWRARLPAPDPARPSGVEEEK